MPQSKKRKDKRGKPMKYNPRTPAFTLGSALDLQTYLPALESVVEQQRASLRRIL